MNTKGAIKGRLLYFIIVASGYPSGLTPGLHMSLLIIAMAAELNKKGFRPAGVILLQALYEYQHPAKGTNLTE